MLVDIGKRRAPHWLSGDTGQARAETDWDSAILGTLASTR